MKLEGILSVLTVCAREKGEVFNQKKSPIMTEWKHIGMGWLLLIIIEKLENYIKEDLKQLSNRMFLSNN